MLKINLMKPQHGYFRWREGKAIDIVDMKAIGIAIVKPDDAMTAAELLVEADKTADKICLKKFGEDISKPILRRIYREDDMT